MFWRRQLSIPIFCVVIVLTLYNLSVQFYQTMTVYSSRTSRLKAETNLMMLYAERQKKMRDTCVAHSVGKLRRILTHEEHGLAYCAVPKAGCTFWINIFRFLHNETDGIKVKSPHEIPRWVTHYGQHVNMPYYSLKGARHFLPFSFRFMFTRNPYSRLWSAYVDKFLLPDYWWTAGQRIIARRPVNASGKTKSGCANDISFAEFLDYVTTTKILDEFNEHWCPVSHMCDPCNFLPDVIGTMETFVKDSHFILSQVNLTHLMDSTNETSHVEDEMAMLIKYNFKLLKYSYFKKCTNKTDVVRRLWKTFQINGYLPLDEKLPERNWEDMNVVVFTYITKTIYREKQKSSKSSKRQRNEAMQMAFRTVPRKIMEKVKDVYQIDFTMFNYDPNPPWMTTP